MNTTGNMQPVRPKGNLFVVLLVLGGIVVALFVLGLLPRLEGKKELNKAHEETVGAVPVVHTIIAKAAPSAESISLPGNVDAIQYTTIYARVDGYLKSRMVDIGDKVKTNQLLAVIDTPTVDQELAQTRADLEHARATLQADQANYKESLAKLATAKANVERSRAQVTYTTVTAKRWIDLATRGAVSLQSRDEKVRSMEASSAELQAQEADERAAESQVAAAKAQIAVAQAEIKAQIAAVKRLEVKQGFQNVTAPFSGIITERKVDPGALITQGSQTSNLELFQLGKIDQVRIYVSVPQRIARYLRQGMKADVTVQEYPGRTFCGIVTNVSGGLDPNTRTRQTEIHIDNPDSALLPGMYAEAKLTGMREQPWIRVPGTTLVTRAAGVFVVVVKDGKAHYQPITIGRDFGDQVEVATGLNGDEIVVVSPSDDLREGEPVQVTPFAASDSPN